MKTDSVAFPGRNWSRAALGWGLELSEGDSLQESGAELASVHLDFSCADSLETISLLKQKPVSQLEALERMGFKFRPGSQPWFCQLQPCPGYSQGKNPRQRDCRCKCPVVWKQVIAAEEPKVCVWGVDLGGGGARSGQGLGKMGEWSLGLAEGLMLGRVIGTRTMLLLWSTENTDI